jgi:uncharacterized membrane protein YccF (DUF307 family)
MSNESQPTVSVEELRAKLNAIKKIHGVIIGIFVVILFFWLVLGHWKENVPVFISTVAMTVAITGALVASRSGLAAEVKRRETEERK